jgi:hypothetical protein
MSVYRSYPIALNFWNRSRYGYTPFLSLPRSLMWQLLTCPLSRSNPSSIDPWTTSPSFEFHVTPTALCPHASMIAFITFGWAVLSFGPWTSTQISTPAASAAFPHSMSALPICATA